MLLYNYLRGACFFSNTGTMMEFELVNFIIKGIGMHWMIT